MSPSLEHIKSSLRKERTRVTGQKWRLRNKALIQPLPPNLPLETLKANRENLKGQIETCDPGQKKELRRNLTRLNMVIYSREYRKNIPEERLEKRKALGRARQLKYKVKKRETIEASLLSRGIPVEKKLTRLEQAAVNKQQRAQEKIALEPLTKGRPKEELKAMKEALITQIESCTDEKEKKKLKLQSSIINKVIISRVNNEKNKSKPPLP